jgi:RNA-directed DNA polymerase
MKEVKKVKYFRYADDIVVLAPDKPSLHKLLWEITDYLAVNLKLQVKDNYQVFPVQARGIDFLGYKIFHTHTLLRKSIKKNFARKLFRNRSHKSIPSYLGWAKHGDTKNLINTLFYDAA